MSPPHRGALAPFGTHCTLGLEYGVRIPANISFQNWSSCPVIPSTNAWSEPLRGEGDGGGGAAVLAGMLAVTGGSGEAPTHVMSPSGVIAQ
jgi:hypothetical protein